MASDNPFTRKRSEPHEDPPRPEYDLSSIAVAAKNLILAIPSAKEVVELRGAVKQMLRDLSDTL